MKLIIGGVFVLIAACTVAAAVVRPVHPADGAKRPAAVLRGRCHCGAIKYEVRGAVIRCSYCDCRGCQRAGGGLKTPYVTVLRADFRVTAGKPAAFRATSKEKCDCYGVWHFCRKCGGPLYWESDNGKELDLFVGSLDDPAVFQPKD